MYAFFYSATNNRFIQISLMNHFFTMRRLKIFLFIVLFSIKTTTAQQLRPTPDSCVVIVHFSSTENIPYPFRPIICHTSKSESSMAITDSLGKVGFMAPKATDITFSAYDGSLLIGNYDFSTPDKPGLLIINYDIQEDFFTEDRTDEILIDTTWANDRKLLPTSNTIPVDVCLKNEEGNPISQAMILFRNPTNKNIFIGQTNDNGEFSILLPKDQEYGVRINCLGSRIPMSGLSTKVDDSVNFLQLELKYNSVEEYTSSEELLLFLKNAGDQSFSNDYVPDLFVLKNVYFDFDKSTLQTISYPVLNSLVSALNRFPKITFEIRGHTDNYGDDDYNQLLSERRAKTVKNHLIENGISSHRIQSHGYGEKLPAQTNDTDSGRQANRRTEVKILSR